MVQNNKLKILIADDEEGLRLSMAGILELEGHKVTAAADGYEAIELVRRHSFDVAFLDIRMPGINGVETFKEIKKISPETITIMMTAYAMNNLITEAVNEGAYACISKPFDMDTVIDTIQEVSRKPFVMVIDDDQDLCNLLYERFKEHGFNVVTRPSGIEGVQLVQRKVPDIVFLDMVMEGMDGLSTLARMKELLGDRCPKTIVMSAYEVGDQFAKARQLGAVECFQKPLDIARLKEMISRTLASDDTPRICIVDDDRLVRDALKKALTDNGYEVDVACSGDEVVQQLKDEAFSVAIVNVSGSNLNNLDLYEKIKQLNPGTGVIIISNSPLDDKTNEALKRNNFSLLQKPFDIEHVLRMVGNIRNNKKKKK